MLDRVLLYLGAGITVVWGIAHLLPTRNVVAGFGTLTRDNRLILTMEWVAEGLALIFLALLAGIVGTAGGMHDPVAVLVIRAVAAMMVIMGAWTLVTGARTSIVPIKLCPFVKTGAALLLLLSTIV